MVLSGATGNNSSLLNGKFYRTQDHINGKAIYKNGDSRISYSPEKIWVLTDRSDFKLAFSAEKGLPFLTDATAWYVFDGVTFSAQEVTACFQPMAEFLSDVRTSGDLVGLAAAINVEGFAEVPGITDEERLAARAEHARLSAIAERFGVPPQGVYSFKFELIDSLWHTHEFRYNDAGMLTVRTIPMVEFLDGVKAANHRSILEHSVRALQALGCDAKLLEAPKIHLAGLNAVNLLPLVVRGITGGDADKMNGTYNPTEDTFNGKVVFSKVGYECHLFFMADKRWGFASKVCNSSSTPCRSGEIDLDHPSCCKEWHLISSKSKIFQIQPAVEVLSVTAEEYFASCVSKNDWASLLKYIHEVERLPEIEEKILQAAKKHLSTLEKPVCYVPRSYRYRYRDVYLFAGPLASCH